MGVWMLQGNEYHSMVMRCPQMFVLMAMMMLKMM